MSRVKISYLLLWKSSSIYATNSALCLSGKGSDQQAGGSDLISPQVRPIAFRGGPGLAWRLCPDFLSGSLSAARGLPSDHSRMCILLFGLKQTIASRSKVLYIVGCLEFCPSPQQHDSFSRIHPTTKRPQPSLRLHVLFYK